MYRIDFYRTPRGDRPFQIFLDGCTDKVRSKFIKWLDLLKEQGPDLKRPYADALRDGIRELRVALGGDQYRALYFFWDGDTIVITHGIIKKTAEVPPGEIDRAIRYRADYLRNKRSGDHP